MQYMHVAATRTAGTAKCRVQQVRVRLEGGLSHPVDSSDVAFRLAAVGAFRQAFAAASPVVLEPHMLVEVRAPVESQGTIMGDLNRRRGIILDSGGEGEDCIITAQVPAACLVVLALLYAIPCT
jgi:elongation factor G